MGRASSSKKVARAAQTGGGRLAGPKRPYGFYGGIAVVVLIGLVLVLTSRDQRREEFALSAETEGPIANQDHWHAAYGVYLCDNFSPQIEDQRDPQGIHTHADGIIHIHPFVRRAAGKNATLGKFFDAVRGDLSDTTIQIPGGEEYSEGDDECGGKPGQVVVKVNDKVVTTNVRDVKMNDRDLITIAFVAEGTGKDVPPPPSAPGLDNLSDVPQAQQQPPGGATTGGTAPVGGETTGGETTGAPATETTEGGTTGATTGSTPPPSP
jgi:hypothetical protein